VFITASSFTKGAREYSEQISRRVILIDGSRLTELMVDHAVGVTNRETFAIQEVDEDFFVEELG
jgi:restriction system protein